MDEGTGLWTCQGCWEVCRMTSAHPDYPNQRPFQPSSSNSLHSFKSWRWPSSPTLNAYNVIVDAWRNRAIVGCQHDVFRGELISFSLNPFFLGVVFLVGHWSSVYAPCHSPTHSFSHLTLCPYLSSMHTHTRTHILTHTHSFSLSFYLFVYLPQPTTWCVIRLLSD